MITQHYFAELTKCEPESQVKKQNPEWIIDERKFLVHKEIIKLMNSAKQMKREAIIARRFVRLRDWFMVELGLNTGLRVAEICSLRVRDLFLDYERSSILVHGKGAKIRVVLISERFKKKCLEYLKLKQALEYDNSDSSFLLCSIHGRQITTRTLQKSFKRILELAELPSTYHPHMLRHTYCTFLLIATGKDFRFVQRQLGHASIRTTQIYAGILESEGRLALERMYTPKIRSKPIIPVNNPILEVSQTMLNANYY